MPSKYGQRQINARHLEEAYPRGTWVIHNARFGFNVGQVVDIDAEKYLVNVKFRGSFTYGCAPTLLTRVTEKQIAIEVASRVLGLST